MNKKREFINAAVSGNLQKIKDLVGQGAVHIYNDEAFRWATLFGHLSVVEYLKEL